MVPSAPPQVQSNPSRLSHPDPLTVETLKRHPMYQNCSGSDHDSDPKTLTRPEQPESCYINITLPNKTGGLTPPPEQDCQETYVEMSTLRPPPPQDLIQSVQLNHDYVNRPRSPSNFSTLSSVVEYNGLDTVTAQKLIENVQNLMSTVKEQAKEILTLKMTVKDLKLKVEALEQLNTEEFEYAE